MNQRIQKAAYIATNRRIVKFRDEDAWLVQSQTHDDVFYKVTEDSCDCPDFANRGMSCKHMLALKAEALIAIITKEDA